VPSLSLPRPGDTSLLAVESSDAVALFADRAKAQGTGVVVDEQTAPLVASICRRLDGLPLAIELAAARLRSLSLSGLADRLDQRFRLLTGGSRTAPERHQTLRATVEWSYSLLNDAERVLLGRLSVFAGSFDLDAAEAVCGFGDIEEFDVAVLLGSLVDKSLVAAESAGPALRYRLLETIRQFATERLAEAEGEAATTAAYDAHYLSVAEAAAPHLTGSEQGTWLARLDADQANLRRAAEHAADCPDGTGYVLRLGVALRRYWMARDRGEEALALLMPTLHRPEAEADPELFATVLVTAAIAARRVDIAIARQLGEQAVKLARQLHASRLLIESLAALSAAYYHAGEPERGLSSGREAVQRARWLGDDVLLGASLTEYVLCKALIDPARAWPLLTEAIACTRRSGDHLYANALTNYAGVHALRAGDIPAARAYLQQAAQTVQAIGDKRLSVSINMGWVLRQDNNPDGARASFEEVLRMSRRNGDRYGIAYASLGLACLAADTDDWHRAAVLHGIAQAFLDRTGRPWEDLEARYRRDSLDQVRAHLGQEQFELAHAKGMALSSDEALDLASGKALPAFQPDLLR
jgi:tetratricopeptide (TPR) repeat protein